MRAELVGRGEPSEVLRLPAPRHHAQVDLLGGIPGVVRPAGLQRRLADPAHRDDREHHIVAGDAPVVEHAVIGQLEPDAVGHPALGADLVVADVPGIEPLGGEAEGDHLAGFGVDLGMGGEGRSRQGPLEVPGAVERLQGQGIHGHGRGVFAQGQELAGEHHRVGVGQVAVHPLHRRIVGEGVAVAAEQGPAGGALRLEAVGLDIAVLQADPAVLEAEGRDRPVGVERHVVLEPRRILVVGRHAKEGAGEILGQRALHLQVVQLHLDAAGGVDPPEHGDVGKLDHPRLPYV